ncbi:hypothetical protein SteCoe_19360 [Stentor coeruleus]|uniref:Uncharacterized protein n=1 Tax=Stentor coeruleus TaxID=5963 RepID=A0A1R2BV04_9CILI|nr:hypothetical protein SteCoe_19360 [Stentor coeruleus]
MKSPSKNPLTNSDFYTFSRPISDYFLAKARKHFENLEKAENNEKSIKNLYQDALDRIDRRKNAAEAIQDEIDRNTKSFKPTNASLKIFEEKRNKELEDAINECESPEGFVSMENSKSFFRNVVIKTQTEYVFKTLKAKVHYRNFEDELFGQTWNFLSPNGDEHIVKELLYDFVSILLDRTSSFDNRVSDLERLRKCVERANECIISSEWGLEKFVSEYEKLAENYKLNTYLKKKEKTLEIQKQHFETSCIFRPEINTSSSGSTEKNPRYETLYSNFKEKEDKILCSKLTAMEKELNECTFAPKILKYRNNSAMSNRSDKKMYKEKKTTMQNYMERELQQCTFKPNISKTSYQVEADRPRGFEDYVEKTRKIIEEKLLKKEQEKTGYGENYEKMRMLEFNPPSFLGRVKEPKNILIYIDVNVGIGKKGKIALRQGDDPAKVAENFCKAYSLGKDYQDNLEEELKNQLNAAIPTV